MLVNKVAQSGLIVLDLEKYYPTDSVIELDVSSLLFRGLVLREKEFRAALKDMDWQAYKDKPVAVWCSTEAIVPQWAYMLVTSYLMEVTDAVSFGSPAQVEEERLIAHLEKIDPQEYAGERVIIKGCGKLEKSGRAYVYITKKLLPVVQTLMFGEPCSTVPVYKKPKS